jgi:hypothetical protein
LLAQARFAASAPRSERRRRAEERTNLRLAATLLLRSAERCLSERHDYIDFMAALGSASFEDYITAIDLLI